MASARDKLSFCHITSPMPRLLAEVPWLRFAGYLTRQVWRYSALERPYYTFHLDSLPFCSCMADVTKGHN